MSLILEALRKSEAERRRGQTPDLHAPLPPLPPPLRRSAAPWLWGAGAAVLAAAVGVWMLRPESLPQGPAGPVAATAADAAAPPNAAANVAERREPVAATAAPAPGVSGPDVSAVAGERTSAPSVTAGERGGAPAAALSPPTGTAAKATTAERVSAPPTAAASLAATAAIGTNASAPAPAAPVAAVSSNLASASSSASRPPSAAPAQTAAAAAALEPMAAPEPVPVLPPSAAKPAGEGGAMRLADLSPEARKQLPPLKLSMHMWNDEPARRFVIVDGQRLAEGDRIGEAVLVAIRPDGAVLDWNGRRLQLSLR
ncbi:general secretion pathway protein GspB [Lysobacter antibioticus]|uniref:general secretion pathway protein GspB n=1 Tax=Lysobacter antibioticus TaxID=84531 RepID=UPI0003463EF1|nr:general secretion pathway protein GspB [Lysobacter antibioticus]